MKVSDYIAEFLAARGIDNVFGYPGGVICHFMDSVDRLSPRIRAHISYHEQGAAFAACGYAQESLRPGVAYATSGPGATNLVTGICNAFFDSIPCIFITGQVDTFALRGELALRQRGFQETDIVAMVKGVTKYAVRVDRADDVQACLERAYREATTGRPGPVLVDLPANVQRSEIEVGAGPAEPVPRDTGTLDRQVKLVVEALNQASRPCLIVGAGLKQAGLRSKLRALLVRRSIPVVASMVAFDALDAEHPQNFGFIGANGHRYANMIVSKSDLIITLGTRLDLKQVGNSRELFAPNARILRVDIDSGELSYPVHKGETQICADLRDLVPMLVSRFEGQADQWPTWNRICQTIKSELTSIDDENHHTLIRAISARVPRGTDITVDVGQHQPWVAQAFQVKPEQHVHFSGGLGAMGYSLPAAIGVHYASDRPVVSFNGDGGVQMNIQEMQFIARDRLPITVVVLNNFSLGMIRHFQEMNFASSYVSTTEDSGYLPPDFSKLAAAYGFHYSKVSSVDEISTLDLVTDGPAFVEVILEKSTALLPKFASGRSPNDQEPLLDRKLFEELMGL